MSSTSPAPPSFQESPALLIFDLDGTLVDSGHQITRAWGRILTTLGRAPLSQEAVEAMVGDGAVKLVERGLAATGGTPSTPSFGDIVGKYTEALAVEPIGETDLYPGVMATLRLFADAGHAMAICTNKPIAAAETALRMTGILPFFDVVIGDGSASSLKPDPAPVKAILDRLGYNPDQAIMIGDHENDVKAAQGAGVQPILVSYGYPNKKAADLGAITIDRFDALPAAVRHDTRSTMQASLRT